LNILRSLNALNADKGELIPENDTIISIILIKTIKQSNLLKNSEKYTDNPKPIIFRIISTKNIKVKAIFA
jgi:hypothetical protein